MADEAKPQTTKKSQKFTPEQYALYSEKQASRKAVILQNFMQLNPADQLEIKELLNTISLQKGKKGDKLVNKPANRQERVESLVNGQNPKKIRNRVLIEYADKGSFLCQKLLLIFDLKTEEGTAEETLKIMQWKIVPVILETIRRSEQPNNIGLKEQELAVLLRSEVPTTEGQLRQMTTVARMMFPSPTRMGKGNVTNSYSGSNKPDSKK
jgi:hypothetical protein